jgi:hypothetical protein
VLPTDALVRREIRPLRVGVDPTLTYEPQRLEADGSAPRAGSVADRAFDGVPIVFRIPVEMLDDRPLTLRLGGAGDFRLLELDV